MCTFWLVVMDLAVILDGLGLAPTPERSAHVREFLSKMGVERCEKCDLCERMNNVTTPEEAMAAFQKPLRVSVIAIGAHDGCGKCPSCLARKKAGN